MSYSDLEYEIFSRQFILQNFNEENIQKLNKAKITIVGLGGIGCPLTQYLVSSGIKNFTFFDGDLVEKSNLARQILYSLEDKTNAGLYLPISLPLTGSKSSHTI